MTGAMAWTKSNGGQRRMKSEQARLTATVAGLETEISELHAQIESQKEQFRIKPDRCVGDRADSKGYRFGARL